MDILSTFHVWQNGQSQGPFTLRVMREKLKDGTLSREALVVHGDGGDWVPLSTYADLLDPPKVEMITPPPAPVETTAAADVPLTVNVVAEWLLRTAFILVIIGVGLGMVAAVVIGRPGLWFCVGPLGLALTAAIFAWSRP
jgi:hypothetical protein